MRGFGTGWKTSRRSVVHVAHPAARHAPGRGGTDLLLRLFHLPTRPLLPEHDCPTSIQADDVKPVLADIDTDRSDHTLQDLSHGVLLSFGASCQPTCRRGPGARPDHPIRGHAG